MRNKLKNYGLWLSVAALLMLIMGNYGLYDLIGMKQEVFKQAIDLVLTIFIGLGIISNPTNGSGYIDK